jgi:hypothetical protein
MEYWLGSAVPPNRTPFNCGNSAVEANGASSGQLKSAEIKKLQLPILQLVITVAKRQRL